MINWSYVQDWHNWILFLQVFAYFVFGGLLTYWFLYKFWHTLLIYKIVNIILAIGALVLGFNFLFMQEAYMHLLINGCIVAAIIGFAVNHFLKSNQLIWVSMGVVIGGAIIGLSTEFISLNVWTVAFVAGLLCNFKFQAFRKKA